MIKVHIKKIQTKAIPTGNIIQSQNKWNIGSFSKGMKKIFLMENFSTENHNKNLTGWAQQKKELVNLKKNKKISNLNNRENRLETDRQSLSDPGEKQKVLLLLLESKKEGQCELEKIL